MLGRIQNPPEFDPDPVYENNPTNLQVENITGDNIEFGVFNSQSNGQGIPYIMLVNRNCVPNVNATITITLKNGNYNYISANKWYVITDTLDKPNEDLFVLANSSGKLIFTKTLGPGEGRLLRISQTLRGDIAGTKQGKIYIGGDVVVNGTLTINSGTIVKVALSDDTNIGYDANRCEIIVNGTLQTNGTSANRVIFTSGQSTTTQPAPGNWYGIRINNANASAKIQYCTIEYSVYGLHFSNFNSSSYAKYNIIRNNSYSGIYESYTGGVDLPIMYNTIDNNGYYGVYIGSSQKLTVVSNTITGNGWYNVHIDGAGTGRINGNTLDGGTSYESKYGIYAVNYSGSLNVLSNTIRNHCQYGIYLTPSSSSVVTTISSNTLQNNLYSGILVNGVGSGGSINGNHVSFPISLYNSNGIYCYNSSPKVENNTVQSTYRGLCFNNSSSIVRSNIVKSNFYGIWCNSNRYTTKPDLGNSTSQGCNQIYSNTEWDVYVEDIYGKPELYIKAEYNYWGGGAPNTNKISISAVDVYPYRTTICGSGSCKPECPTLANSGFELTTNFGKTKRPEAWKLLPDTNIAVIDTSVFVGGEKSAKVKPGADAYLFQRINGVKPNYKYLISAYTIRGIGEVGTDDNYKSMTDEPVNDSTLTWKRISVVYKASRGYFDIKLDADIDSLAWFDEVLIEELGYDSSSTVMPSASSIGKNLPKEFALSQNYPNPFNPETVINYQIPEVQDSKITVSLHIYNITGQLVKTLVNGEQEPGYYRVIWDGKDNKGNEVTSGIYLYKIIAGNFQQVRKMIIMK